MEQRGAHGYWLILLSFLVALVLALLPLPRTLLVFRPEWVALFLIYWSMALPHRAGLFTALSLGVLLDILEGAVLGQNAAAFAVVAVLVSMLYQRVRVFNAWQQAAVIFALIGINQMVCQWVQKIEGLGSESLVFLVPAFSSAIAWPLVLHVLRHFRRDYRVT